jgi:hypothetical protein
MGLTSLDSMCVSACSHSVVTKWLHLRQLQNKREPSALPMSTPRKFAPPQEIGYF